jgi:hypothetical protein
MVDTATPIVRNHAEPASRGKSWKLRRIVAASNEVIEGHTKDVGKPPEGLGFRNVPPRFPVTNYGISLLPCLFISLRQDCGTQLGLRQLGFNPELFNSHRKYPKNWGIFSIITP